MPGGKVVVSGNNFHRQFYPGHFLCYIISCVALDFVFTARFNENQYVRNN